MAQYIHGTTKKEQNRLRLLNRLTNPSFLEWLEIPPGSRILEIGSGLGILAGEVARRHASCEVTGLEYAQAQLDLAPKNFENLHFLQGDAHRLPFPDGHFNIVYARYLLEHVQMPQQVVNEMARVLTKDGKIYLQENNILINRFYPECPAFDKVWASFARLQHDLGGDALVGMKLFQLLRLAGMRHISLGLDPQFHGYGDEDYRPWIINLKGNLESAQDALLTKNYCSDTELHEAYEELETLMDNSTGSAYWYWNRAAASTPLPT